MGEGPLAWRWGAAAEQEEGERGPASDGHMGKERKKGFRPALGSLEGNFHGIPVLRIVAFG